MVWKTKKQKEEEAKKKAVEESVEAPEEESQEPIEDEEESEEEERLKEKIAKLEEKANAIREAKEEAKESKEVPEIESPKKLRRYMVVKELPKVEARVWTNEKGETFDLITTEEALQRLLEE